MTIICLDDKNRPNEIPISKWIKEGQEYTPDKLMKCNVQGGILGISLKEIDLSDCAPYLYFRITRFGFPVSDEVLEKELESIFITDPMEYGRKMEKEILKLY